MINFVKIIYRGGGAIKTLGGLTLSFLSGSKFPVFPYKRGYVKGNQRDVRGTVIIVICHNTYEDLLKMIFPFF